MTAKNCFIIESSFAVMQREYSTTEAMGCKPRSLHSDVRFRWRDLFDFSVFNLYQVGKIEILFGYFMGGFDGNQFVMEHSHVSFLTIKTCMVYKIIVCSKQDKVRQEHPLDFCFEIFC